MPKSRFTIGDAKLNLYIFNPIESAPSARRAAIVFFFGGGWQLLRENSGAVCDFSSSEVFDLKPTSRGPRLFVKSGDGHDSGIA
jgi:hypothetical protein